jgi:hypothetical protein
MNSNDAVGNPNDGSLVLGFCLDIEALNPIFDDVANFGGIQLLHVRFLLISFRVGGA